MIEIYNSQFELLMMDPPFSRFMWRRRFTGSGEFKLETFFAPEKMELYKHGNVVYKRDVKEACFVESVKVMQSIDGDMKLIVSGRSVASILTRRIFTMQGNYTPSSFLQAVIERNFLTEAAANRRVPSLRLLSVDVSADTLRVDFKQQNVFQHIEKVLLEHDAGLTMRYNVGNKSFDLRFVSAAETDVVFSREFANVTEQDYSNDATNHKNVVYVGTGFVMNDNLHGFERREMAISLPGASEGISNEQAARNALNTNKVTKTLSNVIYAYSKQYEYLKDWNLGSVVLAQNTQIGYSERELVSEVTEFYDETGQNLEVNTGDYKQREVSAWT